MEDANLHYVLQSQLQSLDDTDDHASAWEDARASVADNSNDFVSWGGRGRGGRGLARRTFQPKDVVVENVSLQYVGKEDPPLPFKTLLDGASLKLLAGRIYALVARNGAGKSTLLRRIDAKKIPGFPVHVSCMYVPQEVLPQPMKTPMEIVLGYHNTYFKRSTDALKAHIEQLENELQGMSSEASEQMESICEQISTLEEEVNGGYDAMKVRQQAEDALQMFDIGEAMRDTRSAELSGGQRKKISLAASLFCQSELLLLDEPTNYLDVKGLIQLRRMLEFKRQAGETVLIVSHDVDLINDVATDVIHLHNQTLTYYPGNYRDFVGYRNQNMLHMLRENAALEKKRDHMMKTIENIKSQPLPKRGGAKKRGKQIESRKKKLEKQGLEKNEHGHRWTAQNAGSGIKIGSINSVGASSRAQLSHSQLLKLADTSISPIPDKAVQFVFRSTMCTWGEPLIMAMDVGFGYNIDKQMNSQDTADFLTKKRGFLFDCVDMCIDERTISCILGSNGSGKTTLLRLLAKNLQPTEGTIHYAHNVNVAYFDQHIADNLVSIHSSEGQVTTPLKLLANLYPNKTEKEIRGELTGFGLDPKQAATNIQFLSGGERTRLCLAQLMLSDPQVLLMDEPTSHLDVESVDALVYGLQQWNGTVIMVSHDANLIRSLGGRCYVIMENEGKVRTILDGIDFYLKSFSIIE